MTISELLILLSRCGVVLVDANGNLISANTAKQITGLAGYDSADIGSIDTTVNHFVRIEDWPTADGGGNVLLHVDPLKVGNKFTGGSGIPLFSTYAAGISALTAIDTLANWKGFRACFGDVGNGFIECVCNGSRFVPVNGRATIYKLDNVGLAASPPVTSGTGAPSFNFNTLLGNPSFPAIFAIGDRFALTGKLLKGGAGAATADVKITLGTAGTSSDAVLFDVTMVITNGVSINVSVDAMIANATTINTSKGNAFNGTGAVGNFVERTGNVDLGAEMFLSVNCTSKNSNDVIAVMDLSLDWITPL